MRYLQFLFAFLFLAGSALAAEAPKRVLLVTHAGGYMHDSILVAEQVLNELGRKNGYQLTCYRFTADPDKKLTVKRRVPAKNANAPGAVVLLYDIRNPDGFTPTGHIARDVAEALKRRVDPSNVRNIIWRPQGDDRLEIQIPVAAGLTGQPAIDSVADFKRLFRGAGMLEFHILANDMPPVDYKKYVDQLNDVGLVVHAADQCKWFEAGDAGKPGRTENYNGKRYVLAYITPAADGKPRSLDSHAEKPWRLTSASRGLVVQGWSDVDFTFDPQGAQYFGALTESNLHKALAITLDDKVISAPVIQSKISANGQITGAFNAEELDYLVNTLRAGSLPAKLSDEPVIQRYEAPTDLVEMEVTALDDYSYRHQKLMGEPVTREQCGRINAQTLKNFDAVIFFTTSTWKKDSGSHPLTPDELNDLIAWVNNGGAFVAVHCGSDTLHNTAYGDLVGGTFGGHPWLQKVRIHVEDPNHPAGKAFTEGAEIMDEIYQFGPVADRPKSPMVIQPYSREKLHIITTIDPTSIDLKIGARDDHDYASSWCHAVGKGRSFYTALGHHKAVWLDPRFQEHLLGGLKWAMGLLPGDATPSAQLKK